ncbi:MAG: hypothetical protein HZB42_02085 [Sphingobacteriales bacterium]|nr:hypothetical protein [Sphingobacteriales bacterium]
MKNYLFLFLMFVSVPVFSQFKKNKLNAGFDEKEKYFSLNFFSIAEPMFALGPSYGCRFSERSEYFFELAYVAKTPFYDWQNVSRLHGARVLAQYRYHFLQQWKPLINFGNANRRRRERRQPFIGIEFRYKPFSFSSKGNFVNRSIQDTLYNVSFSASTNNLGGALLFGGTFNLSADEKWKLEFTAGIGGKQRFVKLKTIPPGYQVYRVRPADGPTGPLLQEETGAPYFPCAIRLRYVIN